MRGVFDKRSHSITGSVVHEFRMLQEFRDLPRKQLVTKAPDCFDCSQDPPRYWYLVKQRICFKDL